MKIACSLVLAIDIIGWMFDANGRTLSIHGRSWNYSWLGGWVVDGSVLVFQNNER